uniref:Uncharacterized protein n=1 Tax=Pithovirus LCPAC404 TaxID=2506597 RepID=A0A481ZCK3_9VIRU|nr:MAG: uncharacterized protein LCPAC404_02110 [Pithovirus LCPAC404]
MLRIICYADEEKGPGVDCDLDHDMLIFLDKRYGQDEEYGSLIERSNKGCACYNLRAKTTLEHCKQWDKNSEYIRCDDTGDDAVYNVAGDYVVCTSGIFDGFAWRTHPFLIAFVEETDQKDYVVVDLPENVKILESDGCLGPCIVRPYITLDPL